MVFRWRASSSLVIAIARWEKSGPVPPRRSCLLPADDNVQQPPSPKHRVVVDLSSALVPSSIPPEYTTKYFGLVGGELGVMSKVDPLGPRPSSPGFWRATEAAVPSEATLERRHQRQARAKRRGSKTSTTADTADAAAADPASDAVGVGARATWPGDAGSPTRPPGSKDSSRHRRGEVFTAQEPPVTKPVEGPDPPPWSESKLGLLCEPSEGASTTASLASIGAEHGGSSTATSPEDWGNAVDMVPETNNSCCSVTTNTSRGGRTGPSFESKREEDDDEDDSSAFALSFVSAPWAVSDDEGSEQGPQARQTRCRLRANEIMLPSTAAGAKNTEAVQAARRLAALQGAKRGRRGRARQTRMRVRGGGGHCIVESPAKLNSKVVSILQEDGGENRRGREVGITRSPIAIDSSNDNVSTSPFKPQPELYDVWIARDFFHGKGLPTGKRVRGESEPRPPKGLKAAAAADRGSVDIPTITPASQAAKRASEDREPPSHPEQHHTRPAAAAASAGKRCAVRYVGGPEDFTGGTASGAETREGVRAGARSPQVAGKWRAGACLRLEAARVPGATAAVTGVGLETTRVDNDRIEPSLNGDGGGDAGDADDHDGHGNGPVLGREAEEIVDVSGDIVAWQAEEDEEEVDGREGMEDEDEEYFDYAKRFSWQTAAEVVKEAEAEAQARSREQRRPELRTGEVRDDMQHDTDDDAVVRQEEARRQLEVVAAAAAAAASERARVRSDHAAAVAVGRLRAPQSVFHRMHRTPSRPEMRRSVTRGRFSPGGRKLWRQSEGLCPRTGQLCLSPRRRGGGGGAGGGGGGGGGGCGGVGSGGDWIVPFSGGGALDWGEMRTTAVATRRWGSADSTTFVNRDLPTANGDTNGGGEHCNNVRDNSDLGVGALDEGNRRWGSADGTPFVNRNRPTADDDASAGGYCDVGGTDRGVGALDEGDRPWGSADGTAVHRNTRSADGDTSEGDHYDAGGSDRGARALHDEEVVKEQEGQHNELVAEQQEEQRETEECALSKSDPPHHANGKAKPHGAGGVSCCRGAETARGEEDHDDAAISMDDDGRAEPPGGEPAYAAAEPEETGGDGVEEDPDGPLSSTVRCLSYTVKIPWGGHS
ncbi:hypothetical protein Esi_0197_0033 [Ectocarpus siliculosus]|uniref:Uncharacterized protein n=1 Tax=Ectocarpus siliculosus TaxID=2880 RepID=D8LHM5_ECTSI|nr:hypothetical protein Esi_0197_0033 [Ectocarpus siliculosus]|eukprot:CBN79307.1 hypothetical protein Esi_0197_0033 [Ectocarpus siliculosus]